MPRALLACLLAVAACTSAGDDPDGAVRIEPSSAELSVDGTVRFELEHADGHDIDAIFTVIGDGRIDATGLYLAPSTPTADLIEARSAADPEIVAVATVDVIDRRP
jgi:hypothetical protein